MTASRRPAAEGYIHEAGLYGSDEELLALAHPFLLGGSAAGEVTVVSLPPREEALVRRSVGELAHAVFTPVPDIYAHPASTIRHYRTLFDELVEQGAGPMRILGCIPPTSVDGRWEEWLRYELATDVAFAPYPLWALCLYDTRTAPTEVIDDAVAAHASCLVGSERVHNPEPPMAVLEGRPPPAPDPLQASPPAVALTDPQPAEARVAAKAVADRAALDRRRTEDLLVIVSELVSNGIQHGEAPVTVEMWSEPGRVLCSVADAGPGPADPLTGLMRDETSIGGMGLWMAHQLADQVLFGTDRAGYRIRAVIAG